MVGIMLISFRKILLFLKIQNPLFVFFRENMLLLSFLVTSNFTFMLSVEKAMLVFPAPGPAVDLSKGYGILISFGI